MAGSGPTLSKTKIDKAGDALREWWNGTDEQPPADAAGVLFDFREGVQNPMKKVTVGLRQFVMREAPPGAPIVVSQRLKRAPRIVWKLTRYPDMRLSRMQDIGGCRAILAGGHDEVLRVAHRIERNWTIKHRKHYTLEAPAPSGYRAMHLTVERDGRLVEIQLRTSLEHEWAEAVERTDRRLGFDLKSGEGPVDLLEYFRLAAYGLALDEIGREPDEEFLDGFRRARDRAARYFRRS